MKRPLAAIVAVCLLFGCAVAEEPPAAPAYMIVLGEVHDRDAFIRGYASRLPPLYEKYGGEYLAVGAGIEILEGELGPESFVIARWPDMKSARAFWNSPEYQELRTLRTEGNWARFDVFLVPGLPEPARMAPVIAEGD